MLKVFISSTSRDLGIFRDKIFNQLDKTLEGIGMEHFIPKGITSQTSSIENLRKSDVVIFLISPYYGSLLENCVIDDCRAECSMKSGDAISFTHCEYKVAKMEKIPHLTYIINKNWEIIDFLNDMEDLSKTDERMEEIFENFNDKEIQHYNQIGLKAKQFREELNDDNFTIIEEIQDPLILQSITNNLAENIVEWYLEDKIKFPNFCDRKDELNELLQNINGKVEVYGVGGVGKTSLIQVALLVQKLKGRKVITIGLEQSYMSGSGYDYFKTRFENLQYKVGGDKIDLYDILMAFSEFIPNIEQVKREDEASIIQLISQIIKEEEIILFIDDFHLVDDSVKEFVKNVNNIVFSSKINTGMANKTLNLVGIQEKYRDDLIDIYCELSGENLSDQAKNKIHQIAEGHPVSTKLLVKNYQKINFNKFKDFNLRNANSAQVEDFYDRVIKEVMSDNAYSLLKNLSVINRELDSNILQGPFKKTFDIGENDEFLLELVDTEMIHENRDKKGLYEFSFKHIQDALFNIADVSNHTKALQYYNHKKDFIGETNEDYVEILFHKTKSNFKEEILDNFIEIKKNDYNFLEKVEYPRYKVWKRFISIGEELIKSLEDEGKTSVQNIIGWIYTNLGLYNPALNLFKKALKSREKQFGNEHLGIAECLNNIGTLNFFKGEYKEAESFLHKALAIQRKLLGSEHKEIAESLNGLAMTIQEQGKFDEAEPLFREILEMNRKLLGDQDPRVAQSLNNLGLLLYRKKEYSEAETLLREALTRNRKIFGEEHPEISANLNNIALVLREKGEYLESESMFQQVLAMDRKLLGDGHPFIATTLTNMGDLFTRKGDFMEAIQVFTEALDVKSKVFSEDHWEIAHIQNLYGYCLFKKGNYTEAETLLIDSYSIIKQNFGDNHTRTRLAVGRIIDFYDTWSKPDIAEKFRALLDQI